MLNCSIEQTVSTTIEQTLLESFAVSQNSVEVFLFEQLLEDFISNRAQAARDNYPKYKEQEAVICAMFKRIVGELTGEVRRKLFDYDSEQVKASVLAEEAIYLQGVKDALEMQTTNPLLWQMILKRIGGETL